MVVMVVAMGVSCVSHVTSLSSNLYLDVSPGYAERQPAVPFVAPLSGVIYPTHTSAWACATHVAKSSFGDRLNSDRHEAVVHTAQ